MGAWTCVPVAGRLAGARRAAAAQPPTAGPAPPAGRRLAQWARSSWHRRLCSPPAATTACPPAAVGRPGGPRGSAAAAAPGSCALQAGHITVSYPRYMSEHVCFLCSLRTLDTRALLYVQRYFSDKADQLFAQLMGYLEVCMRSDLVFFKTFFYAAAGTAASRPEDSRAPGSTACIATRNTGCPAIPTAAQQ